MDKLEDMASVYEFDPLTGNIPATKVEITVSLCVMYTQGVETKQWREFGRTEVIDNTLNPDFVRKYILDYFFEEKQNLRFDFRLEKPLGGIAGKNCGTIILSAEELGNCRVSLSGYSVSLEGVSLCRKSEVLKNENSVIPGLFLFSRAIKVEVYDWDRDGSHDFIGEFTTSYRELARGQSQFNVYEVVNPKKKMKKKKYVNSGTVTLLSFSLLLLVSEYVCFTKFLFAVKFSGNPSQSTSLHYMNPYQMNAYALALKAVGEIIQDYDSDKMFPALGFGAKLPPDGHVSHEFPLNGNIENPYCNGIEGILEAYHQSLKTVQLYGPTNFAPVVNHVDGSQYFVLLIITDGVISDMSQTKEAIVNAAKLPMSIIIVGVGQAEFDAMIELDGDDIRISSRGKLAERDIVQFVPFRDYMDRTGNHVLSMARLAKDVLAEIPDQFISYMKSRGIKPNPSPPPYTPPGHTHHTQI
uniref:Copine Vb n=1 Tax=Cyprinus carpio TaxID=7962 RepID=A0A8C2JBG6_CYPCA